MFNIQLLEAKTGDSFIVECDQEAIIIDGGTSSVAKKIKRYITDDNSPEIKAIFVTHVDNDHIGGILELFKRFSDFVDKSIPIYMNHPELVFVDNSDEDGLVTYEQGDSLKKILCDKGFQVKKAIAGDNIKIGDIFIEVLTPDLELIDKLAGEWSGERTLNRSEDDLVCSEPILVDCNDNIKVKVKKADTDIVNASSISLSISFDDKKALFLSDSHPEIVSNIIDEESKYDLVKISHHGSKHNTTEELLKKINSNRFIISTNGPSSYKHPSPECLSIIINSCSKIGFDNCTLYFNYKEVKDRLSIKNIPKNIDVKIEYSKLVEV